MKRPRTKIGDVFQIPLDEHKFVCGQIFLKNNGAPLYVGIFKDSYTTDNALDINKVCAGELALVGATMDARIYHGMWKIIGTSDVDLTKLPRPYYLVNSNGEDVVIDFDGNVVRKANKSDKKKYNLQWSRAPMGYEQTIKAIHGYGEYPDEYEKLTIQHSIEQSA